MRIPPLVGLCGSRQRKVLLLKFLPVVYRDGILVERKALAGMKYHAMKKYRWNSNNKDDEIRRLLLNTIDTVEKDNEYLRVINHQLKAEGERQMASFTAYEKALIACSERAEKADQFQDLIIRAAQPQSRLNTPPTWIYQPKDRVPVRNERDHDTWDGDIWVDLPENVESLYFPQNFWACRSGTLLSGRG